MSLTLSVLNKRMPKLKEWLTAAGAEVLPPTNEWEVLRFRAGDQLHVVFKNKQSRLSLNMRTGHVISCFLENKSWSAGVATVRRQRSPVDVRALLARDGNCCFLCGFPLEDDITVEHLVAVTHGGPDHLANKALTHERCNRLLGHKSLMEKIKLRDHHRDWEGRTQ